MVEITKGGTADSDSDVMAEAEFGDGGGRAVRGVVGSAGLRGGYANDAYW